MRKTTAVTLRRRTATAARWLAAVLAAAAPAAAQQPDQSPVLMSADEVTHDRENDRVTARGHVEIAQNERVLLADQVTYDLKADRIIATGNVSLVEPTGEVVFAEEAEVTGDLKDGVAREIRILLTDQSRLAAAEGRRTGGTVMELERAVYSPCQPCRDDPDRPLLWQVKARHVTHDKATQDIEYEDAWLEMFGIPVAYTPYLSHPDPTVERRSGLLAPTFGQSRNLGTTIALPYYWVVSPWQDLTVTPRYTSEQGPVLALEHRRRFTFGEMLTEGSVTQDSQDDVRGHIHAIGRFDVDERWRVGYDIDRASDETYLRRYEFRTTPRPFLTSRVFAEGFGRRSYALVESFAFQDQLSTVDSGRVPFVAPYLQYNYVGEADRFGGHWNLDASALSAVRRDGADAQRLVVRPTWSLPYTGRWGDVYTFSLALQADGYNAADFRAGDTGHTNGARVIPEAALEWRYPFVRLDDGYSHVIQPIILAALSPQWDDGDLPNEDSLEFEFNETNLFRLNPFSGYDRIETGPRVSYGLRYDLDMTGIGHAGFLIGQSYMADPPRDAPVGSGIDDNLSDVVGRVNISPMAHFDLYYRFRLDKDDLQPRRNEVAAVAGPPALRVLVDYARIAASGGIGEEVDREEIAFGVSSAISRNWSASVFGRHDLEEGGLTLANGVSVTYDDECFTLATTYFNSRTRDRDTEAGQTLMVRLVFKTLGEVPISAF